MLSFGLQEIDNSQLEELYLTMGAMRPVVTQMVTRKAYQRDRGICTHQTNNPLDLVTLHPKENIIEGGPRRTWIRKFINYRVAQFTGMSLVEFFELPYDDAAFLVELSESSSLQEGITTSQLLRGLKPD